MYSFESLTGKERYIMIYNISFDICATIITLFSLFIMLSKKDLHKASNRLLLLIIVTSLAACIFDIWSSVGNSYIEQYSYFSRDVLNGIFLFVYVSTACLFAWYMVTLLGINHRVKKPSLLLFFSLEITCFLLLAFNSTFRWVFYYDENGIYSHGTMMYVLYGAGYFYMLFSLFLLIRFRKMLLKPQQRAALLFLTFSIIPIFVQQFFMKHQLIELFFQSMGIFGFLTTVENFDAIQNPITKVYNRAAFMREIDLAIQNRTAVDVIIVKLSRSSYFEVAALDAFRTNGFIASVAEWLNTLSKKIDVYDCERGHFILLAYRNNDHDVKKLKEIICERFFDKWVYQNGEIIFPMQLCVANISEDVQTVERMMQLTDLPYINNMKEPTIVTVKEVGFELQEQTDEEPVQQLGGEVSDMLNDFVMRIPLLTPAEHNILQYYINGHEINSIPTLANITMNTVRKHNKNIYRKLEIGSKEELSLYVDILNRSNRLDELEPVQKPE